METVIVKTRNVAIDFVKVIATLLVLNSHMGICYGDYSALATGGGIGRRFVLLYFRLYPFLR